MALEIYGRPSTCGTRSCTTATWSRSLRAQGRDLRRRPGRRAARAPWSSSAPTASRPRCAREARGAGCGRSTPPARWSPRCTSRRCATRARATTIVLDRPPRPRRGRGHAGRGARTHASWSRPSPTSRALEVRDPERVAVLTQTTLSVDDTREIVEALRRRFPAIREPAKDDICYATQNRQNAVKELARAERRSCWWSARRRSQQRQPPGRGGAQRAARGAYLIEDAADIDPAWLAGATRSASPPARRRPSSSSRRVRAAARAGRDPDRGAAHRRRRHALRASRRAQARAAERDDRVVDPLLRTLVDGLVRGEVPAPALGLIGCADPGRAGAQLVAATALPDLAATREAWLPVLLRAARPGNAAECLGELAVRYRATRGRAPAPSSCRRSRG